MAIYRINEFSLDTNLILPFETQQNSLADNKSDTLLSPLKVQFAPNALSDDFEFSFLQPTARRDHGMLWSYDTQDGVLMTVAGILKMHVKADGLLARACASMPKEGS